MLTWPDVGKQVGGLFAKRAMPEPEKTFLKSKRPTEAQETFSMMTGAPVEAFSIKKHPIKAPILRGLALPYVGAMKVWRKPMELLLGEKAPEDIGEMSEWMRGEVTSEFDFETGKEPRGTLALRRGMALGYAAHLLKSGVQVLASDPRLQERVTKIPAIQRITTAFTNPEALSKRILSGEGMKDVLQHAPKGKRSQVFDLLRRATAPEAYKPTGLLEYKPTRQPLFGRAGFARVPDIPQRLIDKFKITPKQVTDIQAGRLTGLAPTLVTELGKIGIAPKAGEGVLAVRTGEVDKRGAYFSTEGSSTYYDPEGGATKYEISNAKIATSGTPQMREVLENAKALKNSPEELKRIEAALKKDTTTDNFVDYMIFDEVPSIKKAAEKLGYHGVKVWENDDISAPSSIFLWDISKAKKLPMPTPTPEPIVPPTPPTAPKEAIPEVEQPPVTKMPDLKRVESVLPKGKVKPIVRLQTGQYVKAEPTITEPQALKHLLKREEQVSRVAAQAAKAETKETLQLFRRIKKMPIEGMNFEEKRAIEVLKTQVKTTRKLEDLRNLYTKIQTIKDVGKQKFIQGKEAKAVQFDLEKNTLIKTINVAPEAVIPKGLAIERKKDVLLLPKRARAVTLRPSRIFDALDGHQNFEGPNNQFFYNRVNRAVDAEYRGVATRESNMTRNMQEIGITQKDVLASRVVDGIPFTVDEMLSVYAGAKNPEKTLAIVYGNKIPFSTMRNVIAQMTPQEKALGDAIIADYETNYDRLRKAFIEYTDGKTDLGKVTGGYTPIKRTMQGYIPTESELANELLERANLRKAYAERGFTKARLIIPKQYQQPIQLGELSIWTQMLPKQEHFISHGNLVKDMQHMANDPDYSNTVRSKLGEPYLESIRNWVNRSANPNIYKAFSQADKMVSTLRQNAAIAYLGFNLITMTKQAPSLALFLSDVTVPQLLGGIYDLTTSYSQSMKMIHELAPQMKRRSIERELEEFKTSDPSRYRQIVKRFGEKAMIGIYQIDKLVTHSGWMATFNKYKKLGMADEQAGDIATRAVLRTQPAAHAKDLAEIYATSEIWNALLQFSNQLSQIYNIISYDIPAKTRTGKYGESLRGAFGVALSAYLIAWMASGKPATTKEELKETGIEQGLNYIPVIGRMASSMRRGFDFTSIPALSGFRSMFQAASAFQKGEVLKGIGRGVEAAAVLGGVPYAQPRRLFRAVTKREPKELLYRQKKEKKRGVPTLRKTTKGLKWPSKGKGLKWPK